MASIFISAFPAPFALAFPHSLPKLSGIGGSVSPVVLSMSMGFACLVIASIGVSVGESLHTVALLKKLDECA
jgi:NAD/NADP transhydrogenase alpha subunit